MSEPQAPRPAPIPPPDRQQIERLNATFNLTAFSPESNWRRRLVRHVDYVLSRLLFRQREFNAAVVDHLNRRGVETHEASVRAMDWTETRVEGALDELRRYEQSLMARDHRNAGALAALTAAHEEMRASMNGSHQGVQHLNGRWRLPRADRCSRGGYAGRTRRAADLTRVARQPSVRRFRRPVSRIAGRYPPAGVKLPAVLSRRSRCARHRLRAR
jgi:hypothetical protein